MKLNLIGKLAGVLLLSAGLAGCLDASVDVAVTSATTAKATMTQVMGADFYSMVKVSGEEAKASKDEDEFCAEGELTEAADGSATCVITEEGKFADLTMGNEQETITFTPAGPGLVRVALPTADMKAEIGAGDDMDAETKQMIEAFFSGHAVTIRFSGAEVVETNMTLSPDKRSAEQVIPFLDLINGAPDMPDELFAVVRAP